MEVGGHIPKLSCRKRNPCQAGEIPSFMRGAIVSMKTKLPELEKWSRRAMAVGESTIST